MEQTLVRIGTSTNPLRQEARRLIGQGDVAGGQTKLDEALDADEKALAEVERVAEARRKAAAQSALDLAVLVLGTDVVKALMYYQRATRLDPANPGLWYAFAVTALNAGRTADAKTGFEQAASKAKNSNNPLERYWAMLALGDVAVAQGNLSDARQLYGKWRRGLQTDRQGQPRQSLRWQRGLLVAVAISATCFVPRATCRAHSRPTAPRSL